MKKLNRIFKLGLIASVLLSAGCSPKWKETDKGTFKIVSNEGGQTLGYSSTSGIKILTVDRLAFKDLNKNGTLDPYEDWRLPFDQRAKDLASKMTVEQIAGLMLYSAHQAIPAGGTRFGASTYNGKPFKESGALASDLSDQQKKFLTECPPASTPPTSTSTRRSAAWSARRARRPNASAMHRGRRWGG